MIEIQRKYLLRQNHTPYIPEKRHDTFWDKIIYRNVKVEKKLKRKTLHVYCERIMIEPQ